MGFFSNLFSKKTCSICGGEIGLLGNRKLEDGNLCKKCAAKLSPWFNDRRHSTVEEIEQQLKYREENLEEVKKFNITRTFGKEMIVYIDDGAKKFMVTKAKDIINNNPDVIDLSCVTGCDIDVIETKDEAETRDKDGNRVKYNPPKYNYRYDWDITIRLNHRFFNEISFRLNPDSFYTNKDNPLPLRFKPNEKNFKDYIEIDNMAKEIKEVLTAEINNSVEKAEENSKPKTAVKCPSCGATTIPDENGKCEYCGGACV